MNVSIEINFNIQLPVVPPPGLESYEIIPGNLKDLKSKSNLFW